MSSLYQEWIDAKEAERAAVDRRREIEDELVKSLEVPADFDGSSTKTIDGYKVKVTGRIDRKVDADLLQEIAAEHGLQDHLGALFRWKPELDMRMWKSAPEPVTQKLSFAITAKPGRPSFFITKE